MSGGTAVQTESHGVVRAQAKPSHGPWLSPEANAKGLVLTEDGAAGPERKGKKVSPSGLSKNAQGIEAEWPRQLAGSVHESPVWRKPDAPINLEKRERCASPNCGGPTTLNARANPWLAREKAAGGRKQNELLKNLPYRAMIKH